MEKDFAKTQYKRLLEAEALEKKKKKELAQEIKNRKKAERRRSLHKKLKIEKKLKTRLLRRSINNL